jgi:hypothetical protein
MAQTLSSPGVSISVTDDSMYTSAGAGTIPLIFVATAANKLNGSGTGIAPGTLKTDKDYGKVRLLTSPKELTDTFGTPVFKTDSNNKPIHGHEQNEYGLQAAYSYLNVSNRAFVVRADIDLDAIQASTSIPTGTPDDNTFWFDTASSHWGLFSWDSAAATTANGQTFTNVTPTVITEISKVDDLTGAPKASIGATGSYAVVATSSLVSFWYKSKRTSSWVEIGSEAWVSSIPTAQGVNSELAFASPLDPDVDVFVINGYNPFIGFSTLDELALLINTDAIDDGIFAVVSNHRLYLYSTGVDIDINGTDVDTALKIGIEIGIYKAPALTISNHVTIPTYKRKDLPTTVNGRPTGSLWIKTTVVNKGADWNVKRYDASIKSWVTISAPIFQNNEAAIAALDPTNGGLNLAGNTVYVKYNTSESPTLFANFKIYRRTASSTTKIISKKFTRSSFQSGTYNFAIGESVIGSTLLATRLVQFNIDEPSESDSDAVVIQAMLDEIESKINSSSGDTNVHASQLDGNKIVITHVTGGEIRLVDGTNEPIAKLFDANKTTNFFHHPNGISNHYLASLWSEYGADRTKSFIQPSDSTPIGNASDGLLWYDSNIEDVDIMINHGHKWMAYRSVDHGQGLGATNKTGPILSPTKPTTQTDADKSLLVEGDLWIDTSDLENYPQIYRYINFTKKWVKIDTTDQTTEDGIVFADARWNIDGISSSPSAIVDLLGGPPSELSLDAIEAANFVDFDAPNPALYPEGCLLWNLRRSGYNVKKYRKNYVNILDHNTRYNNESMINYFPDRWVTESGNNENGSGSFGRKAQRKVVVQSLQALVNSNVEIREEEYRVFNLIAAPGYPELVGEMKDLNTSRGLTAFVIGDTPSRLKPDATTLLNWGNNVNGTSEDDDNGLVSADPYLAFFYPWGYTSDNLGRNIVVPPSHMMLRTIALSDAASFPWYAPAGTQRGTISNATSVGYIDQNGEWQTVALNTGQRDTLAGIKVNPITFIAGSGLVNMAQYTRSPETTSLDRINVARLVVSLRRRLSLMSKAYLFQPNDDATRKQIKHAAESLLLELQGQRAIYDFVVQCDTSNNTPARVDRSELYLDIAIEPTKAVEFIYIPLRLANTGEVKTIGK